MKSIKSFWLVVILVNVLVLTISGVAVGQPTPAARQITDASGKTRLLSFDAGALGMPARDVRGTALSVSADIVARHASAFGAPANSGFVALSDTTLNTTIAGTTAVRYRQTLGGVPVYGAQLVVNVRGDGVATLMSGEVSSATNVNLPLALPPATTSQAALTYVATRYGVPVESLVAQDGGLWIYDPVLVKPGVSSAERAGLVWKGIISSRVGQPIRVEILVDAADANVRFSFNRIHTSPKHGDWHGAQAAGVTFGAGLIGPAVATANSTRTPGTADLATFTAGNTTSLPGTFLCDESNLACTNGADVDADTAHLHANGTYNYYWQTHGRDSLDDNGMELISTVHLDEGYCNAFWNGIQMAYGDGCTIVVDDVVAHELTHGVTEFSSGLIYAYDSGAINESFSDVWGEYYDLTNGTAEDIPANRWVVGEEIEVGGFRNMEDPTVFNDPDRVGSPIFWTDARDHGGVHINSGINNKAAYLMADGGTFNSQTINGLGMVKPLHIYYYVQTMLASETTNYNDLAVYLAAACDQLVGGAAGITASDCDEVDKVILATELALPSPHLPDFAEVCSTGFVPATVFFDNFENPTASKNKWTTSALNGKNAWTISSDKFPLNGSRSLRADNVGGFVNQTPVSLSVAALKNGVTLPANAYLHFDHMYAWEPDGWDGSVVQYSTDGGATWTTFSNAQMEGEKYPGLAEFQSSIPFAGLPAYTAESFGAASTRIDLSSLAGQTIKIRFYAASDEVFSYGNPDGWWIDDVRVYNCVTGSELLDNSGFETGPARPPENWAVGTKAGTAKNDKQMCNTESKTFARSGNCAFRFVGGLFENSKLTQNVDLTGVTVVTGDQFVLSGYYNSNKAGQLNAKLTVRYTAGAATIVNFQLNPATDGYQSFSLPVLTVGSGTVEGVTVRFAFKSKKSGIKPLLDDLSLTYVPVASR